MDQGTTAALPAEAPTKRRRGRPRKDENQAPPRPPVPSIQGEGSGVLKPTANTPSKGKESIEDDDDDDDDHNNDEMVGQVVTGVLECAFDTGYFLSVKVGDSNVCMRGLVFKEEGVVPVTPENDIAPNAKMYKRKEFPNPSMNISPQVPAETAHKSSSNPAEEVKQQKLPSPSVTLKEDHDNLLQKGQTDDKEQQEKASDDMEHQKLSDDKGHQEKSSDDKEQKEKSSDDKEQQEKLSDDKEEKFSDDKEQHEKLSVGDDIKEKEGSAKTEALKDLSESPMKRQKTDQMVASHSNGVEILEQNTLTSEISEDAVKSFEAVDSIILPKEVTFSLPETALSVKDSSVDAPTVMEQEISRTSGFQISMENADVEDELSEPPSEASPMATE